MAGPAIAGMLVATTAAASAFALDAATYAVSGICPARAAAAAGTRWTARRPPW